MRKPGRSGTFEGHVVAEVDFADIISEEVDAFLTPRSAATLSSLSPAVPEPPKQWEYKVLTQKDKWFSGKFDPERLEQAINAYAKQGWRICGVTSAAINGLMGGNRDEMIIIMER